MNLWIINKEEIGFSRLIAEMIQDSLEDYIEVGIGSVKKLEPDSIIEENIDFLIIGDVISKEIPNLEIQKWLIRYREISNNNSDTIKAISGFYITPSDSEIEPSWVDTLQEYINAEMVYPPILSLKINRADLSLENSAHELVKDYLNNIIKKILSTN